MWHARFTSLLQSISKTGPANYYAQLQALHNLNRYLAHNFYLAPSLYIIAKTCSVLQIQLSWLSYIICRHTQNIDELRGRYGRSETTYKKFLLSRIHWCRENFDIIISWQVNFQKEMKTCSNGNSHDTIRYASPKSLVPSSRVFRICLGLLVN